MECLAAGLPRTAPAPPLDACTSYFPKNEAKARVHAFLAGMHELVPFPGLAAQRGYWNLDHPAMAELKRFLEALAR